MMRFAVNAGLMKKIEKETIEHIGLDALILMERAALELAGRVLEKGLKECRVLCVCGMGNNGGDGVAAARILRCRGILADVLLIGEEERATEQLKSQLSIAGKLKIPVFYDFPEGEYDIIIDALFGIGFHGQAQSWYAEAIAGINERRKHAYIISADIPSGVWADTGAVEGLAVCAHETVAFGEIKLGCLLYPGAEYAGKIHRVDIGFSSEAVLGICKKGAYEYFQPEDVKAMLPKRQADSHKGSYGRVLIIAGSAAMPGAALLSAMAAYHMGVGLVHVLSSKEAVSLVNHRLPEAIASCYDEEKEVEAAIKEADAVAIGPGLSRSKKAGEVLLQALSCCKVPLILDADALNILSEENHYLLPAGTVLTPHLKELSRLLNRNINEIKGNIVDIAEKCTYNNELVYVIKGARTIVSAKDVKYVNLSGNDGMAKGGSGDVLTGIIAALLCRGLDGITAAKLGVYLHGLGGDYAAMRLGRTGMLAGDLIKGLVHILADIEKEC